MKTSSSGKAILRELHDSKSSGLHSNIAIELKNEAKSKRQALGE